jgi:GNAT superfamily N-acetyltransferase
MAEILCREFAEPDWNDTVRFYKEFYGSEYIFTRREFFNWNFFSPLRPDARCGQRVAVDGDKVIGVMGVLAWPLQIQGRPNIGEYNINLYLDPTYRGHRLGQRLLENVCDGYAYSISSGYNERTFSMYERLGRVYHWEMLRLIKCFDAEACQKLMESATRFAELDAPAKRSASALIAESVATTLDAPKLAFEKVKRFDAAWDVAWERIRRSYGFTTWRSAAFLNWRYIDYPYPLYTCHVARDREEIVGLIVLRVEAPQLGTIIRIVDLVCTDEARGEMLAFAERFAKERGAIFMDFIFQGAMDFPLLARSGYRELIERTSGAQLLPIDFNPLRHRDGIQILVTFLEREDAACAEVERGDFYLVKGDGDQDRAN